MKPCARCGAKRIKGKARAQRIKGVPLCFACIESYNAWWDAGWAEALERLPAESPEDRPDVMSSERKRAEMHERAFDGG